jgi:uncharacterized protein (DUF4415 family)
MKKKMVHVKPPEGKIKISINLDEDIVTWFKTYAKEKKRNYQNDINQVLRDFINECEAVESLYKTPLFEEETDE